MRDPGHAGALAEWRALPAGTRRQARRLAALRGEPHPDPVIAAAAAAYATARLAGLRRVPLAVPGVAGGLTVAMLLAMAWMARAAGSGNGPSATEVLLAVAGLGLCMGGFWWTVMRAAVLPRRLRELAAVSRQAPYRVIVRYRRQRWPRAGAGALWAAAVCCLVAQKWLPGSGVMSLAFPLASLGWQRFRHAAPGLPEPAACRIGQEGVELRTRSAGHPGRGKSGKVRTLAWQELTRIVVAGAEADVPKGFPGPLITLVGRDGRQPPPVAQQPGTMGIGPWLKENLTDFTLVVRRLDRPAEEIVEALTAHAPGPLPVESRPAPDPLAGRRAGVSRGGSPGASTGDGGPPSRP